MQASNMLIDSPSWRPNGWLSGCVCSIARSSLLARLAGTSDHVADVGGPGRIREHRRFQILRRQSLADGQSEDVDHLVDMRPDQVRAQDAVGPLFDEDLEPVGGLGDATR